MKKYIVEMTGISGKVTKKASFPMSAVSPKNAVELAIYQVDMGDLESLTIVVTLYGVQSVHVDDRSRGDDAGDGAERPA